MSLNSNKLCERCQCVPCCICCMQCQPFHYFCEECDSRIHDIVIKNNHRRSRYNYNLNRSYDCLPHTRSKSSNNINTYQINNNCLNTKPVNCDQIFSKNISMSPQKNSLNNSFSTRDPCAKYYSRCNSDSIDKIQTTSCNDGNFFTKDYVNNIKNLYEKEISDLQFKNMTLENNLDRVKNLFTCELDKLQKEHNNIIEKNKLIENQKICDYEREIDCLNKERQNLENQNRMLNNEILNLNSRLDDCEKIMKDDSNLHNNQIKNLQNELQMLKRNEENLKENHVNSINTIQKLNNEKICSMKNEFKRKYVN